MGGYRGPATVTVEERAVEVPVMAGLVSAGEPGRMMWRGWLRAEGVGALWPAHLAAWALLVVDGQAGDIAFTAYSDSGPCQIRGLGPPPF